MGGRDGREGQGCGVWWRGRQWLKRILTPWRIFDQGLASPLNQCLHLLVKTDHGDPLLRDLPICHHETPNMPAASCTAGLPLLLLLFA